MAEPVILELALVTATATCPARPPRSPRPPSWSARTSASPPG